MSKELQSLSISLSMHSQLDIDLYIKILSGFEKNNKLFLLALMKAVLLSWKVVNVCH